MIKRILSWFKGTPPAVTQVVFRLPSGRRITAEQIEALIEKVERLEV